MKRAPDINLVYREIEKGVNLTVIADEPGKAICQKCGKSGLTFNCHLFREGKIEGLCKPCAIERAGGADKVWVRTGEYLRRKWDQNARLSCRLPPRNRLISASDGEVDRGE
jgi:hypothetical protein